MLHEEEKHYEQDIYYNRVSSSRFLFYLVVFGALSASIAGCYRLYQKRYPGKPEVTIQGSTKFKPEYK